MTQARIDKPKRGRPKKFVDLELVEKLAHIQCTYPEIASTLGVSIDTLTRHPDFAATFKRGAEGGRKSLRRMQFESANRGNVTMQIWLGKQYLSQSDHVINTVRRVPSFDELTLEELGQLVAESSHLREPMPEEMPLPLPPAPSEAIPVVFTVEPTGEAEPEP